MNSQIWTKLALNLPTIIGVAMNTAEAIRGAKKGAEKEAAVIDAVKTSVTMAEAISGKDLINDPALDALLKNYIAARVSLMNLVAAKAAAAPTP